MNGCLGFQVVIFLRILCQDVVIFAALFEDDAQIIYFENDWKEEDRPRRVKCRNPWCFETQKFRRSEKLRWCARLQDWRWTVRLQTFGTEKFQLMGLFWMDQTPPKNPVKEAVASPGYPVFLHPNTDAQVHKLQALRRLKPLSIHFCRVASLNILLCYFCLQGKQNWRLSSIFFSAKCGRVQCLHPKPFHIARWMLTTAWPSCKSMSLGGFLETWNCCSSKADGCFLK